jgi:hypothetical protein
VKLWQLSVRIVLIRQIPYPEPPGDLDTNEESKRIWKKTERKIRQLNNDLNSLRYVGRCDPRKGE